MSRPRPYDAHGCPLTREQYRNREADIDRPITDDPFAGSLGAVNRRANDAQASATFTEPDSPYTDRTREPA